MVDAHGLMEGMRHSAHAGWLQVTCLLCSGIELQLLHWQSGRTAWWKVLQNQRKMNYSFYFYIGIVQLVLNGFVGKQSSACIVELTGQSSARVWDLDEVKSKQRCLQEATLASQDVWAPFLWVYFTSSCAIEGASRRKNERQVKNPKTERGARCLRGWGLCSGSSGATRLCADLWAELDFCTHLLLHPIAQSMP